MKKSGVIDPVLVTKQAVQNAASIAGTSMTMGALVVTIPKEDNPTVAAAGAGGMGLGM